MNIKQLEYFIDLTKTLNFTKTAQNFYISQTAITKQIQCLENDLGIPLFHRTKKSVSLTHEGEFFLTYAQRILDDVSMTYQSIEQYKEGLHGELRLNKYYHKDCQLKDLKLIHDVRNVIYEDSEIEQTLLRLCLKEGYAILHDFIYNNQYSKYLQYQPTNIISNINLYYHPDSLNQCLHQIIDYIKNDNF